MKVVRKTKFVPITITIESKEEAKALWLALACDRNKSIEEYLKGRGLTSDPLEETLETLYSIWNEYDDVCNAGNNHDW